MNMNQNTASCGISQDVWVDYVEGELDDHLAKDMALHAKGCRGCRGHLHGIRLVKRSFSQPSEIKTPDDLFFKRLEGKIMQAVGKTHIEPVAPKGNRHVKTIAVATAAMFVLIVGTPYLLPQLRLKAVTKTLPTAAMNLEEQFFAMNSGADPMVFGEVIISHQDSDDFVLEAAAEKLSRMSDQDARTALDKMK
jgi:hypothetical protein